MFGSVHPTLYKHVESGSPRIDIAVVEVKDAYSKA
jgi:hypothetical protein